MYAPLDATAFLSLRSRLDGIQEIRWATRSGGRKTTYEYSPFQTSRGDFIMPEGPSLLQRTWYMIDTEMQIIKDPNAERDTVLKAKVRARTLAEVLAMFMVPHFSTPDEIASEAMRRWQARESGDNEYETVGLGLRKYEPPPSSPNKYEEQVEGKKSTKKKSAPKSTGHRIPEAAVATSKQAIEMQMFTVAQIAKSYSMTEAEVKAQLGLP